MAGMMLLTRVGGSKSCTSGTIHCCYCKNRVSIGFLRSPIATEQIDTDTDLLLSA